MGVEIEHKYLVVDDRYKRLATRQIEIRQGYLDRDPRHTVRVRIADQAGYLTIKGITEGASRLEFEYPIPKEDAERLLTLCEGTVIHKVRHIVQHQGFIWEVDEFLERSTPLVIAEIELPDEQTVYPLPPFVGENVTGQKEYYNANL